MKRDITKKIKEFLDMEIGLQRVSDAPGFKFSISVAQNIKILSAELEVIKTKGSKCEEWTKEEMEINKIQVKYAKKDIGGNPVIITEPYGEYFLHKYDILEDKAKEFREEYEALTSLKRHKDAMKKQKEIEEQYNKFITEEEITISLHEIPDSCVPLAYFDCEEHVPALKAFVSSCIDIIGSSE